MIDDPTAPDAPAPAEDYTQPENALPPVKLEDLPEPFRDAAARAGWRSLMPVQAHTTPYMMSGRDLMVQSRTGSGKTGAFLLPILSLIDPTLDMTQAIILIPTRELAIQVTREAEMLAGIDGPRVLSVYGGVGYGPQLDALRRGAHLVVGTPGRILDHLERRTMNLDNLRVLVFDEADRLLSMGFYPDMRELKRYLPRGRASFMFSATFPPTVRSLAREFMHEPDFLSLSRDRVHVAEIPHIYYEVPGMDKDRALVRIIEIENPASALIFCNTKMRVNYVATVLQRFGYDADQLSADLSQKDREKVIERFHKGKLRFLVATDVAARGLDVDLLSHVFQYEFPEETELYIHRAGRTGRAGAAGVAISLISMEERRDFTRVAARYHIDMEKRALPTDEEVAAVIGERLIVMLEARMRDRDRIHVERMQRLIPLVQSLAANEDERPLLAMLLDDIYQAAQQAPAPSPTGEPDAAPPRATPRPAGGSGTGTTDAGGSGPRKPRRRRR